MASIPEVTFDSISASSNPTNRTLSGHVSEHDLAREMNISLRTLRRWAQERSGPVVTKIGRRVFYSRESVAVWLRGREQKPCRRRARAA